MGIVHWIEIYRSYLVYGVCMVLFVSGVLLLRKKAQELPKRFSGNYLRKEVHAVRGQVAELPFFKRRRGEKMDREICDSISFLRNLISIEKGRSVSADYVIGRLAARKGMMQPVYTRMLSFLRLNQRNAAAAWFEEQTGTVIAKEFAALLLRWDEIDPAELAEVLLSHQKSIREVQMTLQKRRDEAVSDLIYLPVVVNIFLVFINFIYISYFMEQEEMFRMLF